MPERRTADAVFLLRRLSKKFGAKNKKLCFMFVDLEKAFDSVPREVIQFALRWKDVQEYLVNEVLSLFKGGETAVSVDGELSSSFSVKVGVHQVLAFSPLSFIIVMDVVSAVVWSMPCMETSISKYMMW